MWKSMKNCLLSIIPACLLTLIFAQVIVGEHYGVDLRRGIVIQSRIPSSLSPRRRLSSAFHFWSDEGAKFQKSSVWARFTNATGHLIDKIEDVIDDEKKAIGNFLAREKIMLENFEHNLEAAWAKAKPFFKIGVKGLVGTTMCLSGAHFGRCVVLFHTMRVTGWPAFQNAFVEIMNSYRRAREVVKEEVGQVLKPRELLQAIRFEIQGVKKIIAESQEALKDGKLTKAEARATLKQAEIDMKRLSYEAWVLNQAVDSFAALSAAIDWPKLKNVGKGVYTGALACVASANSMTVRKLSLAFDLGSILANNINCVGTTIMDRIHSKELARILPAETRRFVRLSISILGAIEGLIIVNTVLPKMSLRISSAALGGAWLTEALAEALDPLLKKHNWPVIEGKLPYALLQVGFTAGGYYMQKRFPGRYPVLIEQLLTPLSIAERQLKNFNGLFKKG